MLREGAVPLLAELWTDAKLEMCNQGAGYALGQVMIDSLSPNHKSNLLRTARAAQKGWI